MVNEISEQRDLVSVLIRVFMKKSTLSVICLLVTGMKFIIVFIEIKVGSHRNRLQIGLIKLYNRR